MLRRASQADVEAVTACVTAAYEPYVERIGQVPGPLLDDYAVLLKNHRAWVLEEAGAVLGLVILMEKESHALLDNVAVHPDAQGRGLGKRLINLAEQQAWALGYSEIQLYTHEKMLENRALYKKLGYEVFDHRLERGLRRVYMKKYLSPENTIE